MKNKFCVAILQKQNVIYCNHIEDLRPKRNVNVFIHYSVKKEETRSKIRTRGL